MPLNLGTLTAFLALDTSRYRKGAEDAAKKAEELKKALDYLKKGAAIAAGAMTATGAAAVKMASDFNEVTSLLQDSFGKDGQRRMEDWAKVASDAMGRSTAQMREMGAEMGALLSPTLKNAEAAQLMSQQVSQLAVDLGSAFNKSDADVLMALRAGLLGSAEPMQKFGVDVRNAAIEQTALNMGIKTQVKDMTEAQRVTLRFNTILQQTANSHNNAAKTGDGLANMMKRIMGQVKDIATGFGQQMLPAVEKLAHWISALLDLFGRLSPAMQKWIIVLGGALTTGAALTATYGLLGPRLEEVSKAFRAVGRVAAALNMKLLPVIAAIAGLVLLAGALKIAWDATSDTMRRQLVESIVGALDFISMKLRDWTNYMVRGVAKTILAIVNAVNKILPDSKKFDVSRLERMANSFDIGQVELGKAAKDFLSTAATGTKKWVVDPLMDSFKAGGGLLFDALDGVFKKIAKASKGAIGYDMMALPAGVGVTGKKGGKKGKPDYGSWSDAAAWSMMNTNYGAMGIDMASAYAASQYANSYTAPKRSGPGFWDVFGGEMKGGAMGFATTALGSADFGQAISAGIGVIAGAMGTAIGGPAGGAIAQAAASGLESILQKAATAIFNSIVEPFVSAFTDQRIQGVIEKSAPLAMIGSLIPVAAFLELSKSTTSYAKVQEKMVAVVDKVVKAMEPFWGYIAPVTEVFAKLAEALSPLVNLISVVFGNLIGRVAFDAIKMFSWHILMAAGLQVRAAQGFASSIEWLVRFIGETLASVLGDDFAASLIDAADGLGELSNGLGVAADALYQGANEIATMSYSMAGMSEQFRNMNVGVMDLSQSLERQNEAVQSSTFNMPSGYRVGIPRFDAENPSLPVQQQQEATTVTLVVHIENVNTESEGAFWESVAAPMSNEEREALITAVPRSGISRWSR